MAIDREELEALTALFDDNDTIVSEAVNSRLMSFGPEIVSSLGKCSEQEKNPEQKKLIAGRAMALNTEFKISDLQDFIARRPGPMSLFEGSWIISSLLDWKLQRGQYEELFFRCSQEYLAEGSDLRTGVENIRILNHIFYHRLKFTLYDVQLTDPKYAMVEETLRTRGGNPFVLAFIYLMICQISSLPVELLCFPGGFVPAYVEGGRILFYINLYRGGELFHQDRLDSFLKATGLKFDRNAFRRRNESAMLTLYLESLLYIYSRKGNDSMNNIIDRALNCLGTERYLTIDETE